MRGSLRPEKRYRPLDYSGYDAATVEWLQRVAGIVAVLVAVIAWRQVSKRVGGGGWVSWVLLQGLCLAAFVGVLVGLDWVARRKFDWGRFRTGLVIGLLVVAGFWVVRTVVYAIVVWIGRKALEPA